MTDSERRDRGRARRPGDTVRSGVLIGLAATSVGQGAITIGGALTADEPHERFIVAIGVVLFCGMTQLTYMIPLLVWSELTERGKRTQGLLRVLFGVLILNGLMCIGPYGP